MEKSCNVKHCVRLCNCFLVWGLLFGSHIGWSSVKAWLSHSGFLPTAPTHCAIAVPLHTGAHSLHATFLLSLGFIIPTWASASCLAPGDLSEMGQETWSRTCSLTGVGQVWCDWCARSSKGAVSAIHHEICRLEKAVYPACQPHTCCGKHNVRPLSTAQK